MSDIIRSNRRDVHCCANCKFVKTNDSGEMTAEPSWYCFKDPKNVGCVAAWEYCDWHEKNEE